MNYGKEGMTKFLDKEGSTETFEKKWNAGELSKPIRHTFEMRHRVKFDELIIISEVNNILINMLQDPSRHENGIRLEGTERGKEIGHIHIVECYTQLEY